MFDMSTTPEPASKPVAWLVLLGGALVSHVLAILIASRRDA
jgi:hypothetical protein